MVLNAAARLVVGAGTFNHLTPVLRDVLHWLPVPQRIQFNFKVALTAFDCVRAALIQCISGTSAFQWRHLYSQSKLRLAQHIDMVVPQTRTHLGHRSFHVAAPVVWNALQLPTSVQHLAVEDNSVLR